MWLSEDGRRWAREPAAEVFDLAAPAMLVVAGGVLLTLGEQATDESAEVTRIAAWQGALAQP